MGELASRLHHQAGWWHFEGTLEPATGATGWIAIVTFPGDAAQLFGSKAAIRVRVVVNGYACARALIPKGDGSHYLILSRELQKQAGVRPGMQFEVAVARDENPELIVLPDELSEVLAQDEEAAAAFEALSPGRKRGIVYYVAQAKQVDTRIQRALLFAGRLRRGELNRPPPRKA